MGSTPGTDAHGQPHGALHDDSVHHEHSDINVRAVLVFVIILIVVSATVQVGMWGLFRLLDHIEVANDPFVTPLAAPPGTLPPQPRLQTTPWEDLKQFRANEDMYLRSYGWIDQKAGTAHLPIEKAKELLVQRGLPARAGQQDPTEGTHVASRGESNSARTIPAGSADMSTPPPPAAPATAPAPATRVPPAKGPGGA